MDTMNREEQVLGEDQDTAGSEDLELQQKQAKEERIMAQLTQMDQKLNATQESQALAKLVADPDVRALLEAKQRGEKVRMVKEAEVPAEETQVDFEALDNKGLVDLVIKKVQGVVEKAISGKIQPLEQRAATFEGFLQNTHAREAQQQVEGAMKKYPDFNQYRDSMVAIAGRNQDLNAEELYLLAKRRSGHVEETPKRIQSERPTGESVRPRPQRKTPLPSGNAGFSQLLSEALDKLDLDGIQD